MTKSVRTVRVIVSNDPEGHWASHWREWGEYSNETDADDAIEIALLRHPAAKIVVERVYLLKTLAKASA